MSSLFRGLPIVIVWLTYRDRVADWTGEGRNTAELYLGMAVHELHGVSPSYEALCRAVAGSEPICALLDRLPRAKRQPNLLLGAVRFLAAHRDSGFVAVRLR